MDMERGEMGRDFLYLDVNEQWEAQLGLARGFDLKGDKQGIRVLVVSCLWAIYHLL